MTFEACQELLILVYEQSPVLLLRQLPKGFFPLLAEGGKACEWPVLTNWLGHCS